MPHDTILGFFLNPSLLVILFIFCWALNFVLPINQRRFLIQGLMIELFLQRRALQSHSLLYVCVEDRGHVVLSSAGVLTIGRKHGSRQHTYLKEVTFYHLFTFRTIYITGTDLGGGCRGCAPPPPEMTSSFLIQLVFCKKRKKLCGLLVLK